MRVRVRAPGRIIVTADDGVRAEADFTIEDHIETVSIVRSSPEPQQIVADGHTRIDLDVSVESSIPTRQKVTIETTLGSVSTGEGAARFMREVQVSPAESVTVDLLVEDMAGTARIHAKLDNGVKSQDLVLDFAAAQRLLDVLPAEGLIRADGDSRLPITVELETEVMGSHAVTLTTTDGILNPAGTSDAERKRIDVVVLGGGTQAAPNRAEATLIAGLNAGDVVLTASLTDATPATSTVRQLYSPPTELGLQVQESSVLHAMDHTATAKVIFARLPGTGQVSNGTQVRFFSCCDAGGGFGDCSTHVSLPLLVAADDGSNEVSARVELTPTGVAFVNELGMPPADNLDVTMFAFVQGDAMAPTADCANPMPGPNTVIASAPLALQKME